MKSLMKSVVACALVACGFAAEGFAGSNTKKVLNIKANGGKSISAGKVIINGNYSYTMTTWIKFDREHMPNSTSYPNGYIFYLNDNVAQRAVIYYDGLTGTIKFERRNGWTITADRISTIDAPPSGEWHYLTCVYDKEAQARRIYLDGLLKTNETDTSVCSVSCNFGFAYCDWGHVLRGQVAEMSIWSKALTVEEIKSIMTARPEGDEFQDCLAYWPFDEGDGGTTARDIATGQFPLTIAAPTAQVLETVTDFPDFDEGDPRTFHPVTINYPADKVTVTDNAKDDEKKGNKYLENSEVTFTATADSGTFVRWAGDVPEDQATSTSITLTIDGPKMLCPIYSFGWQYDTKAKTMTDGYWTLKATVNANREMTVTGVSVNSDGGILNLDQPVTDESGATYSIVTLGSNAFKSNLILKEVWLPNTLKTITQSGWWGNDGVFWGCANLKKVTPFLPDSVEFVGIATFKGCTALEGDLVMNRDGRPFTFDKAGGSATFAGTKITSVWLGAGVTNIVVSAFDGCTALTNVTWTGEMMEVGSCAFNGCTALQKVTPFDFLATSAMGDRAFNNCSALEGELSLGLKCNFRNTDGTYYGAEFGNTKISSITLGKGVTNLVQQFFTGCKSVTEVRFLGCPQQIVGSAFNGWTAYQACFYVPFAGTGWESYSCYTPWRDLGDDIKAKFTEAHPGARHPIGLTTAPKDTLIPLPANQWLCNLKEPGMKLIFR